MTEQTATVETRWDRWQTRFEDYLTQQGRSPKTIEAYLTDLRVFSAWFEEVNNQPFEPSLFNSMDLRAYREWSLKVRKIAPKTWNRRRGTLKVIFSWAKNEGLTPLGDPFTGVLPAKEEELPPFWLERSDYARLMRGVEQAINSANTPRRRVLAIRDGAMIALMIYAGLRVGEVCALKLEDIEITERKGRVIVRSGKGGKKRQVPLSSEARRLIDAHIADMPAHGLVFEGISIRGIEKRIDKLAEQFGVADLTPHRLRHTFGKRMVDAGRPLTEIKKLMGHSSIKTTIRYVQPGWEDLEDAVESVALGKMARR